jgi:hypothetical protein
MSQELHQLLKSLNKGEKRAIILAAEKTEGDKNFLELYYAIIAQDKYDEQKIIAENKDRPFIKHLGFTKNYLQNFILKELRSINSNYKVNIRLKNFLIDIELMFWKGQFKMAIKLINQAKVLAEKYEYHLMLEELYYWERRIITSGSMKVPKVLNYSEDIRFKIMDSYFNALEYKKIINEVTAIIRESDEIRDDEDLNRINSIMGRDLLVDIKNAKSKKAAYDFYILNAALSRLKGDYETSNSHHQDLQKFIKENSHIFIEENPIFFLGSSNNVMLNALQSENFELYDATYKTVTSMVFKEEYTNAYYNSRILIFLLNSSIQNKTYQSVKHLASSDAVLGNDLMTEEVKLLLNYYCVVINFHCKDYKEALVFINRIINNQKQLRVDIIGTTMIFNLLVHLELGHYDYIDNVFPNHFNFLKKNRLLSLYDSSFVRGLAKVVEVKSKPELRELLKEIETHLLGIKNKKSFHHELDYLKWLEEKIKQ